jgi:hypothetical protein
MRSIYNWMLMLAVLAGCGTTVAPEPAAPAQELRSEALSAPEAPVAGEVPTADVVPVPEAMVPEEEPEDRARAVEWMVGFMTKHAPPGRRTFYPEAQETKEEALVRYNGIANAIVDVVYDPTRKPLFGGSTGRARSATVILALMLFESGFMKNVDFGAGKFGRGDGGRSWCLLQINIGAGRTLKWNTKYDRVPKMGDDPADIFEGYTGPELVADRKKCVGEAYKALRLSFNACQSMQLPVDQKLRVYGSGNCNGAVKESRLRMRAAIKFWDETHKARGFTDATLTATVAKGLGLPYTPSIEKAKPPTLLAPSEPAPVENSVPPKDLPMHTGPVAQF